MRRSRAISSGGRSRKSESSASTMINDASIPTLAVGRKGESTNMKKPDARTRVVVNIAPPTFCMA